MKNKDQILLEQEYDKVVKNPLVINPDGVQGIGTKLRPNYSFSQISDKNDWIRDADYRFQGIELNTKDFNNWYAKLKYANQIIDLKGIGHDVFVDGNKISPEDSMFLRKYIRKTYGHNMPDKNPAVFNGRGEKISLGESNETILEEKRKKTKKKIKNKRKSKKNDKGIRWGVGTYFTGGGYNYDDTSGDCSGDGA